MYVGVDTVERVVLFIIHNISIDASFSQRTTLSVSKIGESYRIALEHWKFLPGWKAIVDLVDSKSGSR
jgi:hypothetical protein